MVVDAELVKRLNNKDTAAFLILYDTYSPCLFEVILKNIKDYDAACIVLKESFIQAWHSIGLYHEAEGSLLHWMLRIAIRLSKQSLCKRSSTARYS